MMIEIQNQASSALPDTAIAGPVLGTAADVGTRSGLDDRHPLGRPAAGTLSFARRAADAMSYSRLAADVVPPRWEGPVAA